VSLSADVGFRLVPDLGPATGTTSSSPGWYADVLQHTIEVINVLCFF